MKTLLILITAAVLAATSLTSCTSDGTTPDVTPILSGGVTYKAAKIAEKKPSRIDELHAAADALDELAAGIVNRETVTTVLQKFLSESDAEERALLSLIAGYFPSGDAAIPVNEKLSVLARNIAAAIRLGLPSAK